MFAPCRRTLHMHPPPRTEVQLPGRFLKRNPSHYMSLVSGGLSRSSFGDHFASRSLTLLSCPAAFHPHHSSWHTTLMCCSGWLMFFSRIRGCRPCRVHGINRCRSDLQYHATALYHVTVDEETDRGTVPVQVRRDSFFKGPMSTLIRLKGYVCLGCDSSRSTPLGLA